MGFRACLIFLVATLELGAERPNFVFIQGEGQGWNSTSVLMDPAVSESKNAYFRTPNLARLAERGMRFANFYAPSPRCTPSRAAYFTGKSPAMLGMTFVSLRSGANAKVIEPLPQLEMPREETTIAEVLRDSGYATAHFGKWHVGRTDPREHGFEDNDGANNNGGRRTSTAPTRSRRTESLKRGLSSSKRTPAWAGPSTSRCRTMAGEGPPTRANPRIRL